MNVPLLSAPPPTVGTPFDLVDDDPRTRVARKSVVLPLSRWIEEHAANQADPPVVMATFQHPHYFTPASARQYARLATHCPLVLVIGVPGAHHTAPGVRGVPLSDDDPLRDQWSIVVVGAHYASAFIARDLHDDGPEQDRRFEYLITHDRDIIVAAGRTLLDRLD